MMFVDPETGKEMTLPEVVIALLVAEHSTSKEEATLLVKSHPRIMMNGTMAGRGREYRATAMALSMVRDLE